MNLGPTRSTVLPTREVAFAGYPQRDAQANASIAGDVLSALRASLPQPNPTALPAAVARGLAQARARLATADTAALTKALPGMRARIRQGQLRGRAAGWALALAAHACRTRLGLDPYDTQILAAWLMIDGHFAEVATGEGKTVAAGLAAAAAALAGIPVHLFTANDYLVQRDRERMAPMYDTLGLSSACVLPAMTRAERARAYRADIVLVTARELTFDYLRDHLLLAGVRDPRLLQALAITSDDAANRHAATADDDALRAAAFTPTSFTAFDDLQPTFEATDTGLEVVGTDAADTDTHAGTHAATTPRAVATPPAAAPTPVLPGLCLAILDEADSILLDEATVPLILAAPIDAVERRSYERATTIAGSLRRGPHYALVAARHCELTDEGRAAVTAQVELLDRDDAGLLRPLRRAHELVAAALSARHALHRDRHYLVRDGKLHLVDEVTGRIADGRQWTGPLQAMVELKEGLEPSPGTRVSAQITYQRFFPRYLRLGGMSGTLAEAQRELRVCYGAHVHHVPLVKPDRRQWCGERVFVDAAHRDAALARRVAELAGAARPVLVGTDSIATSARIAQRLREQGLDPQVLDAAQDAHEARCVERAGHAGVITVATNMAGRGTDIALDARARDAGGLHVIATMRNRSRRIDRQLIGRAARHGDPGSAESMLALDDAFFTEHAADALRRAVAACARDGEVPASIALPLVAAAQRRAESRDRALRARLRGNERHADEFFAFAGGIE